MGKKDAAKAAKPCCKYCKAIFDETPNPCVKNPGPSDTVKRRQVTAKECKGCLGFLKTDEEFGGMTASALSDFLEDEQNQRRYNEIYGQWCAKRREGGRRARSRGALSKLCALSKPDMQESVLMEEKLTSLVSFFNDEDQMQNLTEILPEWGASLLKIKESIESSVGALMQRTTATFHGFVLKLLEPEVDLNAILQTGIVGAFDADSPDDKDGKIGLDYGSFYVTYKSSMQLKTKIESEGADGSKTMVPVDVSFLCLAGALLGMAKYMNMFKEKVHEIENMKSFDELAQLDYESIKHKRGEKVSYKSSTIAPMCACFSKFAAMAASFETMIKHLPEDDKEKVIFKLLMNKMGGMVSQLLAQCNNEIVAAWNLLDKLFKDMQSNHNVPEVFQGERLDKIQIASLVDCPVVKLLLFVGGKCSGACEEIKQAMDGIQLLPKDLIVTQSLATMISAVLSDLKAFGANANQGPPKAGVKVALAQFSFFQGSLTLSQCLCRDLKPGETRLGLTKRCIELLNGKGIGFEESLKRRVDALTTGK